MFDRPILPDMIRGNSSPHHQRGGAWTTPHTNHRYTTKDLSGYGSPSGASTAEDYGNNSSNNGGGAGSNNTLGSGASSPFLQKSNSPFVRGSLRVNSKRSGGGRSRNGGQPQSPCPASLSLITCTSGDPLLFSETNLDWSKLNIFRTRLCDRLTHTHSCHMANRCLFSHEIHWPRRTPFLPRASALTLRYIPVWCPRVHWPPVRGLCESSGKIDWVWKDCAEHIMTAGASGSLHSGPTFGMTGGMSNGSIAAGGASVTGCHIGEGGGSSNGEAVTKTCMASCCPRGDNCPFVHSIEEFLYHPEIYKTRSCCLANDEHFDDDIHSTHCVALCPWYFCPFAHDAYEIRDVRGSRYAWHQPPQIVDNQYVARTQGFNALETAIIDFVRKHSSAELYTLPNTPLKMGLTTSPSFLPPHIPLTSSTPSTPSHSHRNGAGNPAADGRPQPCGGGGTTTIAEDLSASGVVGSCPSGVVENPSAASPLANTGSCTPTAGVASGLGDVSISNGSSQAVEHPVGHPVGSITLPSTSVAAAAAAAAGASAGRSWLPGPVLEPASGSSLETLAANPCHGNRMDDLLCLMALASLVNLLLYPVENFYVPTLLSLQCSILQYQLASSLDCKHQTAVKLIERYNMAAAASLPPMSPTSSPTTATNVQHYSSANAAALAASSANQNAQLLLQQQQLQHAMMASQQQQQAAAVNVVWGNAGSQRSMQLSPSATSLQSQPSPSQSPAMSLQLQQQSAAAPLSPTSQSPASHHMNNSGSSAAAAAAAAAESQAALAAIATATAVGGIDMESILDLLQSEDILRLVLDQQQRKNR